jgi:hypothetical protein
MIEISKDALPTQLNSDSNIKTNGNLRTNKMKNTLRPSNKSLQIVDEKAKKEDEKNSKGNSPKKEREEKNEKKLLGISKENLDKQKDENTNTLKNTKRKDIKKITTNIKLEAISEQAELNNSILHNEKKEKEHITSTSNNIDGPNSSNILLNSKYNSVNRTMKECENNMFKNLIDLSDLIESDYSIEYSLKEVENILLRNLSDMKTWYKYYTNKDNAKEENNSNNHSVLQTQDEKESKKESIERKPSTQIGYNTNTNSNNNNNNEKGLGLIGSNHFLIFDGVFNNDISFSMEMRDLWKFLRDSMIISSEFSLAQFNRIFYKGKNNYFEMFSVPEDIEQKYIYEYLYGLIKKSKDEFQYRFRDKYISSNLVLNLNSKDNASHENSSVSKDNESNFNSIKEDNKSKTKVVSRFDNSSSTNKKIQYDFQFDIHNKKQTILLRHFFEAIVRAAFLRFCNNTQTLGIKLSLLIDTCIKKNPAFKKTTINKKSRLEKSKIDPNQQTDNSINNSVFLDKKTIGSNFEFFAYNYEKILKGIFRSYFIKSNSSNSFSDMTITYKFFYDYYVKNSEIFSCIFSDKLKFTEIITVYHKDKISLTEMIKYSKEIYNYIDNIYDLEFIFFEFVEVIFFMSRKYFNKNNLTDTRENYNEIIKDLEDILKNGENPKKELIYYEYPKVKKHYDFEKLIAIRKEKEEIEKKKKKELRRMETERKLMEFEDLNMLAEENEEKESDEEEDEDSY